MSDILHINASPREEKSASRTVALAMLDHLKASRADIDIDTLDLFEADLPEFNAAGAAAKYSIMAGEQPTDDAGRMWQQIIKMTDRLKAAKAVVLSTPMWNFSIPYKLKQYIDLVAQPSLTFSFSPSEGYKGLVTGRPVMVIVARGGEMSDPSVSHMDLQLPYLKNQLGFLGFTDIRPIIVEPTLRGGAEVAKQKIAEASEKAIEASEGF